MRHIKIFEDIIHSENEIIKKLSKTKKKYLKKYKFFFDDYVRCSSYLINYRGITNKIFIIGSIDVLPDWETETIYGLYEISGDKEFVEWVKEENLTKVENWEVEALKYNL